MIFLAIVAGTLLAGVGSVWLAAGLANALLGRFTQHLLSLAAGALLATAFMRLLPEAFELAVQTDLEAKTLFAVLLVGLVFFFLLDKAELWHHGHEHHHDHASSGAHDPHHPHHHHHHAPLAGQHSGGWAVLLGDSLHAFGDGILIAAAFMADPRLGVASALAVPTHEVPHHVGDLVVLRQTLAQPQGAVLRLSLSGAVTTVGGVVGYALVGALEEYLPLFLVVASSSFIYVALADLIPQLQKRLSPRATLAQVLWLVSGMAVIGLLGIWLHH